MAGAAEGGAAAAPGVKLAAPGPALGGVTGAAAADVGTLLGAKTGAELACGMPGRAGSGGAAELAGGGTWPQAAPLSAVRTLTCSVSCLRGWRSESKRSGQVETRDRKAARWRVLRLRDAR
jgi:hypothetical protein